jgi:hypothetical protein
MQRPHLAYAASPPAGCLLRLVWTLAGNSVVSLSLVRIAATSPPIPSTLDAVVWVTTLVMLLARYLDIARCGGRTWRNEPATLHHWRVYRRLLVIATLSTWLLAHWLAGSFAPQEVHFDRLAEVR